MSNMNSNFFWSFNFLLAGSRLVGGQCIWSVVGWSVVGWLVGRCSVVSARLISGFKETQQKDVCVGSFLEDAQYIVVVVQNAKLFTTLYPND